LPTLWQLHKLWCPVVSSEGCDRDCSYPA